MHFKKPDENEVEAAIQAAITLGERHRLPQLDRDAEDVDVLGEPLAELGQLLRDLG